MRDKKDDNFIEDSFKDGYDPQASGADGHGTGDTGSDGYDSDGYTDDGYDGDGYGEGGYGSEGYAEDDYDSDGYSDDGYDRDGYDSKSYAGDGYDSDGYSDDGYDSRGYAEGDYDAERYASDEYDTEAYDSESTDSPDADGADVDSIPEEELEPYYDHEAFKWLKTMNRAKLIRLFAMLVFSVAVLIFASIAWFTMNETATASGLQIKVQTPDGLYISLGATNNHYRMQSSDYLLLSGTVPVTPTDDDWTNEVEIDSYYKFGKMMPASSTTGENVFFTPDSTALGRDVKREGRYFQANGHTDGYLKNYVATKTLAEPASGTQYYDATSLAATAHAFTEEEIADKAAAWTGEPEYKRNAAWNDTNDDGYYVDIPVWLRTGGNGEVNVKVYGLVTAGPISSERISGMSFPNNSEPLYKATRVALLDESGDPLGGVTGSENVAYKNILPLKNQSNFEDWSSGTVILDSYNYLNTARGSGATEGYYAVESVNSGTTGEYAPYEPYDDETVMITLDGSDPATSTKKFRIRVWLDGEDMGCWNPNAGQDWTICLKFLTM